MATMLLILLISSVALEVSGLKLQQCPPGFFCAKSMRRSLHGDDGYEMPRPCPRGTWSGAGAVECTDCPKGHYTWDEASTYCEICEFGYMCPAPNVDPQLCPLGTYNPEPAQVCCRMCSSGSYTPQRASTRCAICRPGMVCPRNEIKLACLRDSETTTTPPPLPTTTTTTTTPSPPTTIVTELNPCLDRTLCLNGGTCRPEGGSNFSCLCTDRYSGVRCEESVDQKTITEVLTRNNWTDVLAVIDVTGSMAPCASTVSQWMTLAHQKNTNIKTYVFFNDGDSTADKDKVIGSTGGIYATSSTDLSVVRALMQRTMRMGSGGDGPENDIEALLYGIGQCPTCQNVIHIADNAVTPRDLILLPRIKVPIKVIPCQVVSGTGVNPALINIALKTGGSIHTIEEDIIYLSGTNIGETINIGHHVYRRTKDGFIRV